MAQLGDGTPRSRCCARQACCDVATRQGRADDGIPGAAPGAGASAGARAGLARAPDGPRPGRCVASAAIAALLALPLIFLLIEAHGAGFRHRRPPDLPPADRDPALEHGPAHRGGHRCCAPSSARRPPGGRADRPARPPDLGGPARGAARHPRLRGQLRLGSLFIWIQGFRGAVIVMTLAVYPLVYLPVAASLRAADPGQEEVARSLGAGRVRTFFRDHAGPGPRRDPRRLPARGAGAARRVRRVRDRSATRPSPPRSSARSALSFSVPAACALSLVLVATQPAGPGRRGVAARRRPGQPVRRAGAAGLPPLRLGRARLPALAGFALLAGAGARHAGRREHLLDGPWRARHALSRRLHCWPPPCTRPLYGAARPRWTRCSRCRWRCSPSGTPGAAGSSSSAARTWCWPCRASSSRSPCRTSPSTTRTASATRPRRCSCSATRSCSSRWHWSGVKASIARAPASLDEVARSLGQRRLAAFSRVTLRLAAPGLMAAFCLVFLSVVTELTATLMLIPTGAADPGHPVLGVREQPVLRPGGTVRAGDDRRRRGAELRARPVLQPLSDGTPEGRRT